MAVTFPPFAFRDTLRDCEERLGVKVYINYIPITYFLSLQADVYLHYMYMIVCMCMCIKMCAYTFYNFIKLENRLHSMYRILFAKVNSIMKKALVLISDICKQRNKQGMSQSVSQSVSVSVSVSLSLFLSLSFLSLVNFFLE